MNTKAKSLTVVLPVFNERENLEFLLPQLMEWQAEDNTLLLEVTVVDDGSVDGTGDFVNAFSQEHGNVRLLARTVNPSLPNSIAEGVYEAGTDFVAWLDADGSMPISDLKRMWVQAKYSDFDFVIGSRFVNGGGFKGMNVVGRTSLRQFIRNIRQSQDSFSAIFLSRALNYFLRVLLRCGVRDLTSGFMLVRRELIQQNDIRGAYGDYCPPLIYRLVRRGTPFVELGYICLPRQFGESKTGATLRQYIRRGLPYISESFKVLTEHK